MKAIVIEFTLTRETAAGFIDDPKDAATFLARDPAELRCRVIIKGLDEAVYWQEIDDLGEPYWRGGQNDQSSRATLGGTFVDRSAFIVMALRMLVTGRVPRDIRELPSGAWKYDLGTF